MGGKKCHDDVTKNGSENILKHWDGGRIDELIFKMIGLSLRAFRDCQPVSFRTSAICIISVREGEGRGEKERCVIRRGGGTITARSVLLIG